MIAVAAPKTRLPSYENPNRGKQWSETMESKGPRQIDEFKVMDEHGND